MSVELCWQTIASVLIFVTWYYPTGLWRNGDPSFGMTERGGLVFLLIWLFCLWITTFSQAVGVGIEHAETAVQVATLCFWLSLVFCGSVYPASKWPLECELKTNLTKPASSSLPRIFPASGFSSTEPLR